MTRPPVGLLDTSAVIALPAVADATDLPERPLISAITLAELAVGPLATDDLAERARRQAVLQQAEGDFRALPFDDAAARAFGIVAVGLRARGRTRSARAFDVLIAAVALAHELPLFTTNAADFVGIPGLVVHAVPVPRAGPPAS